MNDFDDKLIVCFFFFFFLYFSKCRKFRETLEASEANIYEAQYLETFELVGEALQVLGSTTVQIQLLDL